MYDESNLSKQAVNVKKPDTLQVISDIKGELFQLRDKLSPVIQAIENPAGAPSVGSTHLMQELLGVLEIIRDLKQDIYF